MISPSHNASTNEDLVRNSYGPKGEHLNFLEDEVTAMVGEFEARQRGLFGGKMNEIKQNRF